MSVKDRKSSRDYPRSFGELGTGSRWTPILLSV
jgi:hypothetical protein